MSIYENKWFEIWYSEGSDIIPTHLLLVISEGKSSNEILIIDQFKNNEIVFRSNNYDEICSWLWEDEYHLVNGREFLDDGW